MKAIRSDNGTKFKNYLFDAFYLEHGIEHRFCAPRVPQQNGVVERNNRTLVEMARTMLDEHRTPRKFWAEAISTACYISNRIFLHSILNSTSYELHFGRKLKVSHLRVFWCRCFILKCGNLDKFESCSFSEIFLGYSLHGYTYRVYNLDINTIMEFCDVTFNESTLCASPGLECADDQEMSESIFVD